MQRQSWITLTAIQIGGALCVPQLGAGYFMGLWAGFLPALACIVMTNSVCAVGGMLAAWFGAHYRSNTLEAAGRYLGAVGGKFVSASFFISSAGWFSIHLSTMAQSIATLMPHIPMPLIIIVLAVIVTVIGLGGISAIGAVARWAMPFYAILVVAMLGSSPFPVSQSGSSGAAALAVISLVAALGLGTIANFPTFFCTARSVRDACIAGFIVPAVCLSLIQGAGAYLGAAYGGTSLLTSLLYGASPLWSFALLLFIVISSWTALNNALYSGGISVAYMVEKLSEMKGFLLVGIIGTMLSLTLSAESFCKTIELIGIPLIPVGCIIIYGALHEFFPLFPALHRRTARFVTVSSVLLACLVYGFGITITGERFIDIALAAVLLLTLGQCVSHWQDR